ncbi:uncharacterized protein LOC116206825 [Punica granatum]|uniref:Membrane-associated kinase regulator 1 n=2 Tax=Punica granatum TaxID=22663 RepID=A0A218XBQ3_PUNGR|nr:uncharacterized protein LOC116206825 [Punica granatum]OWM82119.1 hypothetical protein CDL15_Pgr001693 [Punica granatum]PKI41237.1 hypothetical protein CRG98_038349 [Punica granatum]
MAKYWSGRNQEEEEEEEEALSLCDLPINLVKTEETHQLIRESSEDGGGGEEKEGSSNKTCEREEPEFDFGWWGNNRASVSSESHMCAADELFFKGQLLPLRLSLSSENGLVYRSMSRSESMDHGSVSRFIGSRSSSIGSYHSSSSSSTNSSFATNRGDHQKPPFRNHNSHTHPSPKPQSLNAPFAPYRQASLRSTQSHNNRFSLWDFFRTGLVRTPATDIELRDLKFRRKHSVISRNNSNSSTNSNSNSNAQSNSPSKRTGQSRSLFNRNVGGLLGVNCKCSVETVPLNAATTKADLVFQKRRTSSSVEEKLLHNDSKKTKTNTMKKKKKKMKQKQAMSRQRTSEWLKELSLSHATS